VSRVVTVVRTTDSSGLIDQDLSATLDSTTFSVEDAGVPFPEVRVQKTGSNTVVVNPEGFNFLDSGENPLLQVGVAESPFPNRIYYRRGGTPPSAVLVKDQNSEIVGSEFLTFSAGDELVTVGGSVEFTGGISAFNFTPTGRVNDLDSTPLTQVVTREYIDLLRSTYSSALSTQALSLTNDTRNPKNSVLYKSSDSVVGSPSFRYESDTLYVPSTTCSPLNASSTTLSGTPQSSGSSSTHGVALFTTTPDTGFIPTPSVSAYVSSGIFLVVRFHSQTINQITGLTSNSPTGAVTIPAGGIFSVNAVLRWGNWGAGWRITWISNSQYSSIRFSESWGKCTK
jgi:hypothetical protein